MASVDDALRTQIANIEQSSGRTMSEWRAIAHAEGLKRHGEIVAWLKRDHGLSHGSANRVALEVLKQADEPQGRGAIDAIYGGRNAALRPLHDRIVELAQAFGPDIELAPKKAWLSLRRKKQFATIGPASASRIEVGLNLPDTPATDRLESTPDGMLSRRVRLSSETEVDAEFRRWLRDAYDRS